jgi:hypothetical protein
MPKRKPEPPQSPRIREGNAYGGSYLFPCVLSDDCGGVLLWEDHPQPDGSMIATVLCSVCSVVVDGADVLAAIASIERRVEIPTHRADTSR